MDSISNIVKSLITTNGDAANESDVSPRRGHAGFTLIELVVVLLILSLLTSLAVRELGHLRGTRQHAAAVRQLDELQSAVWQETPGAEASGFFADTGRLPRALAETNELGRTVLTLAELWRRPSSLPPFALRRAVASNLVCAASVKSTLADESVIVPCGWRGPYLRLPTGRTRLLDPWGNPLESPDDAGYARLFSASNTAAREGRAVRAVAHFGADARPDTQLTPADESQRDGRVDFSPRTANPLAVEVTFIDASGPTTVTGNVRCRWYMPCGGAITGDVAQVSLTQSANATFSFEGLPQGECALVIDVGGEAKLRERVRIPSGGRVANVKVRMP